MLEHVLVQQHLMQHVLMCLAVLAPLQLAVALPAAVHGTVSTHCSSSSRSRPLQCW